MAQLESLCELEQGSPSVFHAPGVFPRAHRALTPQHAHFKEPHA